MRSILWSWPFCQLFFSGKRKKPRSFMPHRPVRQRKVHNVFVGEAARNRRNGCGNSCGGGIPDGLPANSQSIPWNLESFSSPAKRAMENML